MPSTLCTPALSVGADISRIALTLSGSTRHVSNKRNFRLCQFELFDVKFKSAILAQLKEPHQVLVMVSRCML